MDKAEIGPHSKKNPQNPEMDLTERHERYRAFLVAQLVKNPRVMQETWV